MATVTETPQGDRTSDTDLAPRLALALDDIILRAAWSSDEATDNFNIAELHLLHALEATGGEASADELRRSAGLEAVPAARGLARLRGTGLVEGGKRNLFVLTVRGRAMLERMRQARVRALERFVAALAPTERMRLEGALHLLGDDLDRLSRGALG
jgi:DNA-binding MarR family transcriptional regulator